MEENQLFIPKPDGNIVFYTPAGEMLRITEEGEFFVKGSKVCNDDKIYEAFVSFLTDAGWYGSTPSSTQYPIEELSEEEIIEAAEDALCHTDNEWR